MDQRHIWWSFNPVIIQINKQIHIMIKGTFDDFSGRRIVTRLRRTGSKLPSLIIITILSKLHSWFLFSLTITIRRANCLEYIWQMIICLYSEPINVVLSLIKMINNKKSRYVAMVLDRLFLWIFTIAVIGEILLFDSLNICLVENQYLNISKDIWDIWGA